jgi:hypothetical protein
MARRSSDVDLLSPGYETMHQPPRHGNSKGSSSILIEVVAVVFTVGGGGGSSSRSFAPPEHITCTGCCQQKLREAHDQRST